MPIRPIKPIKPTRPIKPIKPTNPINPIKQTDNMKKTIKHTGKMKSATLTLLGVLTFNLSLLTLSSCSDMLETDSDRQNFNPELGEKSDSVFYAYGIAQAMQQLADQYFFQGEMRGELIKTTDYTDNNLRQLANFSADVSNKYDSAYVYYRVINNCNYYLAHRDTNLLTGATKVARPEYAAVKAFRAWAYLQLVRNYGRVPFFTEPLTTISQIDDSNFPEYGIEEIAAVLCPDLQQYSGVAVPNYGTGIAAGSTNFNVSKSIDTRKCFIPVDVILGELYLESGQYQQAVNSYVTYLTSTRNYLPAAIAPFRLRDDEASLPTNMKGTILGGSYTGIFANNATTDIVSYIPMAVNRVRGTVTNVPYAFGYDYYALSRTNLWREDIQLQPSDTYKTLTADLPYYYYENVLGGLPNKDITFGNYGDMRSLAIMRNRSTAIISGSDDEEYMEWIDKFQSGNIILYRVSTIYLHLCEALNRLEQPDVAFAFLKEGITANDTARTNTWLSEQGKNFFRTTFLNEKNGEVFYGRSHPIHERGFGVTSDGSYPGSSPYQYGTEVTRKLTQLVDNAALYPGLSTRLANSTRYAADRTDYETALAAYNAEWATYNAAKAAYDAEWDAYNAALAAYNDYVNGVTTDPVDEPTAPTTATPTAPTTSMPTAPSISAYGSVLTKADTIMAVEELLCDEEAMEFCFEGTRWYDLMRFARHKNRAGLPGNAWLADKLKDNAPVKSLATEQNWYLPFKK